MVDRPNVDCRFHLIPCQHPDLETSLSKIINTLGNLQRTKIELGGIFEAEKTAMLTITNDKAHPFLQFVFHSSSPNKNQLFLHHI